MKKIEFITPRDAEFGFSLAGIAHSIAGQEDAEAALEKTMSEPDIGLIILDERILPAIDGEKMREMEKRWQGILLVLPSPGKPSPEIEDYAARLIRRAVGYHVRLKW